MKTEFTHFEGKISYLFNQYNHNYDYASSNDLEPEVSKKVKQEMTAQLEDIIEYIQTYILNNKDQA